MLDQSCYKPDKIWVDKGNEFYNSSMKLWLAKKDVKEMYSINNEGKCVVAERVIRTLKNKVYKYMTSVSKSLYTDKLENVVNKQNHMYHGTIKMEPVNVKSSTYIDFNKKNGK